MNRLFLSCLIISFVLGPMAFADKSFSPIPPQSYDRIIAFRSLRLSQKADEYAYFRDGRIYFADFDGTPIADREGYEVGQVFSMAKKLATSDRSRSWFEKLNQTTTDVIGSTAAGIIIGTDITALRIFTSFDHWPGSPSAFQVFEVSTASTAGLVFCTTLMARHHKRACMYKVSTTFPNYARKEMEVRSLFGYKSSLKRLVQAMDKENCELKLKASESSAEDPTVEAAAILTEEQNHD